MVESRLTHFGSISVVERVFDHQSLQHLDGDLTDLSELLKSPAHLPEQQPNQEVVPTEVVSQRIVELEICSRHPSAEITQIKDMKPSSRTGRREQALRQRHFTVFFFLLFVFLTLEPLYSAFSKGHGQIERNIMLVVANNPQELKLELIQSLGGIQEKTPFREALS